MFLLLWRGPRRVMACSTCHVHLAPEWIELVGYPSEVRTQKIGRGGEGVLAAEDAAPQEEVDMIDLANDPQPTSRLGCQVLYASHAVCPTLNS